MRLLLCDLETGEFYNNPKQWVHSHNDATAFSDVQYLLNACEHLDRTRLAMIALDENNRPRYAVPLWGVQKSKPG
jgi:hypothetical protein